jgi:ribose transport system substrate-binding protein
MRLSLALGLLLSLVSCTSETTAPVGGSTSRSKVVKIAVIPKGTTHEFWKSIHAGAVKAQRELDGVEIVWRGPQREDDRVQQIGLVENFISTGIDAIVLAPLDDKALAAPVKLATARKIPVVVIDSGLEGEIGKDFAAYVATDNFKGGEMAGEHLGSLLGGAGKVLLLRYQEGSASTDLRERGFIDAISKLPGITLIDPKRYAGASRDLAQQASENLLDADSSYDGIFCPNESATFGMLLALRARNLAGKVKFVGFDASPGLIDALGKGQIHGLIVQDPVKMGYLGTKVAVAALRGESYELEIDTGVSLVTLENRDDPAIAALLSPPIAEYLGE